MIEREIKKYFEGIPVISKAVGGVYAGRIPRDETAREVIVIRRIANDRTYGLYGEDDVSQPVLEIDILSRNESAAGTLFSLFENCRKALNKYAAAPGQMGSIFVNRALIVNEGVDMIISEVGGTWKRQRTFDIQVMHEQETTFA